MTPQSNLAGLIKEEALRLGFSAVGIARLPSSSSKHNASSEIAQISSQNSSITSRLYRRLTRWLELRFHATMEWMERDPKRRADPAEVLPGCQSLIIVGMNYFTEHVPNERGPVGRIARYAWGEDYHHLMKTRLVELEKFLQSKIPEIRTKIYVDTGPIMEKAWAQEAGLGWIGKHTNLVSTEFGSWLVLGEILSTIAFNADEPSVDLCETCSLCIQACPTGAIVEPYLLDAERCISYLTIEFRGKEEAIPAELKKKIGNRIFGCDDCLDICPFNVNAQPTSEEAFQPSPWKLDPQLGALAQLSKNDFLALTQNSPLRRPKHEGFLRNVNIGMKNVRPHDSSP